MSLDLRVAVSGHLFKCLGNLYKTLFSSLNEAAAPRSRFISAKNDFTPPNAGIVLSYIHYIKVLNVFFSVSAGPAKIKRRNRWGNKYADNK